MASTTPVHEAAEERVDLLISGMTCASCAARIEKRLNKLEGITATVNYATEQARVTVADPAVVPADLIAQVEAAGYAASVPAPITAGAAGAAAEVDETASLRHRLAVATALSVPVVLMAMVPALQFDGWQWLSLTLAAPAVPKNSA